MLTPHAPTLVPAAETVLSPALAVPAPPAPLAKKPSKPSSGRWPRRAALAGLVVGLIGLVVWFGPRIGGGGSGDRPLTAKATRGELKVTVTDRGELESSESVQVQCELEGGGKLVTIVPEGTRVKKGDEVAKLDTDALVKSITEQEVKWEQAEGKAKSAKSELSQAKNKRDSEVSKAQLTLDLAKIDREAYEDTKGKYAKERDEKKSKLEQSKRNHKKAQEEVEFTEGLIKKGFAQMDELRRKRDEETEYKFAVASAEADLYILEKFERRKQVMDLTTKAADADRELGRTKESQQAAIEKAEGELKATDKTAEIEKGQLERLRKQMDRCTIKAPSEGIVVYFNARWYDDSSRIRPGATLYFQQTIFSLPDLSKMRVKMKVHESVVKKVRPGQPVTMTLDALPGRVLNGKVVKIATLAQSDGWRGGGVKQYETEVSIDDLPADGGLKPGMTAEVKILINTLADAITIPVQAVTEYDGKHVVYLVNGSKIERREVQVGETNETLIQVTDGLDEGETVALDARARAAADLKASGPKDGKPADKKDEKAPATDKSSQPVAQR